jgi:hypothetical protein
MLRRLGERCRWGMRGGWMFMLTLCDLVYSNDMELYDTTIRKSEVEEDGSQALKLRPRTLGF